MSANKAVVRFSLIFVSLFTWLSFAGVAVAAPAVTRVDSIAMNVGDLARSVAFYRDVLDFTPDGDHEVTGDEAEHLFGVFGIRLRIARLHLGDEHIELMQFIAPAGRPIPADSHSNDRWFQHIAIIVSDMDKAYARLREHSVQHASPGPQRLPDWNPNAGGIKAFYFRDPDGNHLEILQFPPGKGDPRWQKASDRLFLGIDHTAIVVADTDASLTFYRDTLGLRIAGTSDNFGPEQERLNNVFGAHLRITALRAGAGPGVELLEYLSPQGGRPIPPDTRANDRWHWQINVSAPQLESTYRELRLQHRPIVSPTVVSIPVDEFGFGHALLIRDPDGHELMLAQP
jgi:catechol 2,3-dioxygenase-like lactoylglutathione lyase family enzyme